MGPRYISSAEISCVKLSEVLMMPLCVFFYNGETPPWTTAVGGLAIAASIAHHSLQVLREEREAQQDCTASLESMELLASADHTADDEETEGEEGEEVAVTGAVEAEHGERVQLVRTTEPHGN
jgi:hypothetical protein